MDLPTAPEQPQVPAGYSGQDTDYSRWIAFFGAVKPGICLLEMQPATGARKCYAMLRDSFKPIRSNIVNFVN